MPVIRRYSPGIDSGFKCEGCYQQRPEIVVEQYPTARDKRKPLCRACAVQALENHPNLVAHALLNLILGTKAVAFVDESS